MKAKTVLTILIIGGVLLASCRFNRPPAQSEPATEAPPAATAKAAPTSAPEPQAQVLQFNTGRNDYSVNVDNTPREFIGYVPLGYDPNIPTPLVYMIHGSNQSGKIMYENTDWAEKAEQETMIVVYPTSGKYRTTEVNRVEDKWNTPGTEQIVLPGTELKDDVKFMRIILESLKATFNIDDKRIFASGFSNGGGFVLTRLIPDMNDVFAAYSTAGAGLVGEASVADAPVHISASLYSVLGTNDNTISENQGIPIPFPLTEQEIVNDPIFHGMLEKTNAYLNLEQTYTVESDPVFTRFAFANSTAGADNEYIFMMIRGMAHVYPSGDNNRAGIDAADLFWDFFLEHPKP